MHTEIPRALSSRPIDATVIPLPTDETTPPETKMYFVARAAPVCSTGFQRSTLVAWGSGAFRSGAGMGRPQSRRMRAGLAAIVASASLLIGCQAGAAPLAQT